MASPGVTQCGMKWLVKSRVSETKLLKLHRHITGPEPLPIIVDECFSRFHALERLFGLKLIPYDFSGQSGTCCVTYSEIHTNGLLLKMLQLLYVTCTVAVSI